MHAFVVFGLVFFHTKPWDWLMETFPKWPVLRQVGRTTTTRSINLSSFFLMLIWLDQVWYGMCSMWVSGGLHATGIYIMEWDMQADTDLWYGCCCCALQNNSRAHIQCSEVVHGDEPASVWWMHTELQGRSTDVSWFVAQFVMSLAARLMAWIWLCQIIPNSHRQARADKTVLCRVCLGDANWILDNSRVSPTENIKSYALIAIVQFTPPWQTRHRQDCFVVSGVAMWIESVRLLDRPMRSVSECVGQ